MWALSSAQTGTARAMWARAASSRGGQRLLDELDAGSGGGGEERLELIDGPGLVGVGDEARIGTGGAHRRHALRVAGTAELQLEQLQVRRRPWRRRPSAPGRRG